jgi:menaquinone-dependent protoporphyrinogen IX oxidase
MKQTIIIYASQYGSTKRYAERLSAITGIKCVSHKEEENIQNYERIIYMGALIRNNIKSQIPAHLYNEDKIFHLRGAIDYSTMGMKHSEYLINATFRFVPTSNRQRIERGRT